MTVTAVGEPVSRCHRGRFAVAILPGTADRDEPPLNSPHDQWDAAAIAVAVAMGDPGDGPLDEVYATISDWNPSPSLCLVDWQVAEVQQAVGHDDRAGGCPASPMINPDHGGGQVQDGSGEADGLGAVIHSPPSWHRRKQQSCCRHRNRQPPQLCRWVGLALKDYPGSYQPNPPCS